MHDPSNYRDMMVDDIKRRFYIIDADVEVKNNHV
jgi:hypothetical protein